MRFPVFGKCLKWVLQVCFRRLPVGRDCLEVKKIIKVKFLWIIAATAGRFYEWVSEFLEKLTKEHNGVKYFLKKKNFFYTGYDTYQSKTCVVHIEQVIDKSLINSTNSFMNLLHFLHMRVICCKYCKKYMAKSNQETFNFFGRIYGHFRLFLNIGNRF